CTEINDDEVVYLETYYLPKFPIVVLDYGSKIVKSNKNGTVIKEISFTTDSLKSINSCGLRIGDRILAMTFLHSKDSFYLQITDFDTDLNVQHTNRLPFLHFTADSIVFFLINEKMHLCRDQLGNTYMLLLTGYATEHAFALSFDNKGNLTMFKLLGPYNSTTRGGFYYDPHIDRLVYFSENSIKRIYSKKFDLEKEIILWKDNDPTSDYDTISGFNTSFLTIGDKTVRFGEVSFLYKHDGPIGRALSYIDANGSLTGNFNFTPYPIGSSSEETPRLSGSLFFKDNVYYTLFEYIPRYLPFNSASNYVIAKFDTSFKLIEQTEFVFDSNLRIFPIWADFSQNNTFTISGFYYNTSPSNPNPFINGGAYILGLNEDGSPPTLNTKTNPIRAIITIKGNPTSDYLTLSSQDIHASEYEVRLYNLQGRLLRTDDLWEAGTLRVPVYDRPAGTYIYQVWHKGRPLTSGKFVKI
ncbi:MAG: T9SS type A sorting domain-containing protein, partial [Saprospiraceae bacterium]|nr:T9SS type A sorting domain-containing protein [Saprospiraceae bacterium]